MDGSSNEKWLLLLSGDGDGDRDISKEEFYDQDRQDLKTKKNPLLMTFLFTGY